MASNFWEWLFYAVTFTASLIIVLGVIAVSIAEYLGWRDERAAAKQGLDELEEYRREFE